MREQVFQCPDCGTPLQHLSDSQGHWVGTLEDALADHRRVCHKAEEPG